ncbi:uncharacterized protein [Drosophila suzukii]
MGYRSPARCLLLRPIPFHGFSAWSHHPCVIDVSSTIDTDGEALPPALCDISTYCRYFHFSMPIERTIFQCLLIAYRGATFPGSCLIIAHESQEAAIDAIAQLRNKEDCGQGFRLNVVLAFSSSTRAQLASTAGAHPHSRPLGIVSMASISNSRVTTSGDTDMSLAQVESCSWCSSGDSGCSSTNFNTVWRMNQLLNIVCPLALAEAVAEASLTLPFGFLWHLRQHFSSHLHLIRLESHACLASSHVGSGVSVHSWPVIPGCQTCYCLSDSYKASRR